MSIDRSTLDGVIQRLIEKARDENYLEAVTAILDIALPRAIDLDACPCCGRSADLAAEIRKLKRDTIGVYEDVNREWNAAIEAAAALCEEGK